MARYIILLFLNTIGLAISSNGTNPTSNISKHTGLYDVVWNTPSESPAGSMPFGGGDIGGNVWVEEGNVYLYLQKSGCFSGNGEYLKLGRFRLSFTPNIFNHPDSFVQRLYLRDGYVFIKGGNAGTDIEIKLWVDIATQSVHITAHSKKKISMEVSYESWRTTDKELTNANRGCFGCFGLEGYPGTVWKTSDTIRYNQSSILFYHRNSSNPVSPALMIEQQGLSAYADKITNHNRNLTFGGVIYGDNLIPSVKGEGVFYGTPYKSWNLRNKCESSDFHVVIATHREQAATAQAWESALQAVCEKIPTPAVSFSRNKDWWHEFWIRSWIITDPLRKEADPRVWQMGRNYQLMRFQLGCNLYGEYPTKFNGGNFTFDPVCVNPNMKHDPDWRQWGGDVFTAQNQRLLYWPMLKSGDFDGMKSQFNLYEWGLQGAMAKVKTHFGHAGAVFSEYANASGLDIGSGWGWEGAKTRQRGTEIPFGDPRADATKSYNSLVEQGVVANGYIAYHWESQVETAYMMLEYNRFTGRSIDRYMPFIKNALIFFDEHYQCRQRMRTGYPLDEDGKLVIFPSTSCESYRGATNPADLVSGIRSCIEALLEMESDSLSADDKAYFREYLHRLPGLYFGTAEGGDTIVKPAEHWAFYQNVECPQFYPLFPFNRYDIKNDTISFFRNTWKHGTFPKDMVISWHQDGIFLARMGMTEDAFNYNLRKLEDSQRRFPTFWGPGHDWAPDHNWGGAGMIGLQEMLLQTVGNRLYVLPAWPVGKDVCFKLHAPYNTTIEVEYIGGKVRKCNVSPQSRQKDVVVCIP